MGVAPLYETKNETKNDTNNDTNNDTKGDQTVPPPSSLIHTISGALKSKKNNNGDPKYDYQLCGVVIHAGVAGGGHYWSIGRTTEKKEGASEKKEIDLPEDLPEEIREVVQWYKFNDDHVTSFEESGIGNECFGGTETVTQVPTSNNSYYNNSNNSTTIERDRSTNAVMIFYERVLRDGLTKKKKKEKKNNKKKKKKIKVIMQLKKTKKQKKPKKPKKP